MNFSKLILLVLLLALSCKKKHAEENVLFCNEGRPTQLNGPVKQMKTAPVDDKFSLNPGQDYDIVDINKNGEITKVVSGFHGMVSNTYYVTAYDVNGNKLETKGYYNPSEAHINRFLDSTRKLRKLDTVKKLLLVYKYNKQNEIVTYVIGPDESSADSSVYSYNSQGLLMEQYHYTHSKLPADITRYKYDNKNNLIESDIFQDGKLTFKMTFKYKSFDSHNNWIDMTRRIENSLGFIDNLNSNFHRKITYY